MDKISQTIGILVTKSGFEVVGIPGDLLIGVHLVLNELLSPGLWGL